MITIQFIFYFIFYFCEDLSRSHNFLFNIKTIFCLVKVYSRKTYYEHYVNYQITLCHYVQSGKNNRQRKQA